ncbi:hypothetical protein EI555_016852 [Monodon monoceros]|uniref:G-protein coupled receptors family 1 profile domain-containing protein n=1 Tax=Monodon monoceros TaxID=40151 RepID=A0A4U1EIN4_MONMO|nr:hypothetical protein EI555_016852 [Monodon monoceros]
MVVSTVALCGNALLIFLIYIDPRTPMYFFLSHLSLMDLMLVCATVPKMVANFSLAENPSPLCVVAYKLFFSSLLWDLKGSCRDSWLMTAIHPLHYPILMSQRVCLQVAGSSWTLGIIGGMMQMAGAMSLPYCGSRNVDHFFCEAHKKALATCSSHLTAVSLFYGAAMFIYLRPRRYQAPSHDNVVSYLLHSPYSYAQPSHL